MRRPISSPLVALICLATVLLTACAGQGPATQTNQVDSTNNADLQGVKRYLENKAITLKGYTEALKQASERYYRLANGTHFDYNILLKQQKSQVITTVQQARDAWMKASPTYEQMEGIVAGQPELSRYDLILDAGVSGSEGGEDVAPVDLILPDGRKLIKPGNLFGVAESTLWGTETSYIAKNITLDFNNNGKNDLGDILPDANVLKSAAEAIDKHAAELLNDARKWQPTVSDIFSALTANVPTIGDFFESWKTSRFVSGDTNASKDFAVISRLSDIIDNITSWQTMYKGVSPLAQKTDEQQDRLITKGFTDLKTYVENLATQEHSGKRFTPAEADLLSAEAQRRADAINGQITQLAAKLNIRIKQ
jgi:hypothetical protein